VDSFNYSILSRLQRDVRDACDNLPISFDSLHAYLNYRTRLIHALEVLLPIVPFPEDSSGTDILNDIIVEKGISAKLLAIPMRGVFASAIIYRPQSEKPTPAVIVCPGYGQRKQDEELTGIGLSLARQGIAAIIPDYTGTGFASNRPDIHTDVNNHAAAATLLGASDLGLRVEANRALFAYLRTNPMITKIGITGLCQGSIVAWYTMAATEGFSAAALLCGMTTYEAIVCEYMNHEGGWTGISPYLHGVLRYGDAQHIISCFAPAPLLVINNIIDRHWPLSGFQKARVFLEHVYSLWDAPLPKFMLLPCSHAFAEPQNSFITEFFKTNLLSRHSPQ